MADLQLKIPRDPAWPVDTKLQICIGTENAGSLAASTPTGGVVVQTQAAWANSGAQKAEEIGLGEGELGYHGLGSPEYPRAVLRQTYRPTAACCRLPVGVSTIDEAGNRSGVLEQLVRIDDPPQGARGLKATPGMSNGAVVLTWSRSKDA